MTTATAVNNGKPTTAELLAALPDEKLKLLGEVIEILQADPTKPAPVAQSAAPEPEPTTQTVTEHEEFQCVHTIARLVLSKLLAGEVGNVLFEQGIIGKLDIVENLYLDITEAIETALPACDTDDLKKAALAI